MKAACWILMTIPAFVIATMASAQVERPFKQLNLDSLEKTNAAFQKQDVAKSTLLNQLTFAYSGIYPNKGIQSGEQAIGLAQKLNLPLLLAEAYYNLGLNLAATGEYDGAMELYQKALAINQSQNNNYGIAHNTYQLGDLYRKRGDNKTAYALYEKSLTLLEETKNRAGVAVAYRGIKNVHHSFSDYNQALEYFQRELNSNEQSDDKISMAFNLNEMAQVYTHLYDYPKSIEFYLKAVSVNEQLGNKAAMARNLDEIGSIYKGLNDYPKSLEYYQKALDISEEIGDKEAMVNYLGSMSSVYNAVSDYSKALEYSQRALSISEQLGDKNGMSNTLFGIGYAYLNLSDFPKALEYSHQGLSLLEQIGNKGDIGYAYHKMGNIYILIPNYPKALEYYQKALSQAEQITGKNGMAENHKQMGFVYLHLYDYPRAFEHFQKSLRILEQLEDKINMADVLGKIGNIYRDAPDAALLEMGIKPVDRFALAVKCQNHSLLIAREIGTLNQQREAWQNLNIIYEKQKDFARAYEAYKNFVIFRDSVQGEETKKQFTRKEMQYAFDKKETDLKFHQQLTDEQLQRQQLLNRQQRLMYLLAGITFLGIAGLLTTRLWHARKKHQLEADRLKELDKLKTNLYTNITHEFRTPLTVITGVASELSSDRETFDSGVQTIKRNSARLLNLVNQMLDLSKLQSGALSVHFVNGDIVQYAGYIVQSFQSYASSKHVTLHFIPEIALFPMDYDAEKMLQIISNLISNAIKFTSGGGNVYVHLGTRRDNAHEQLIIKVQDTGIGIAEDQVPQIFNRFYQIDETYRSDKGTGIGLSLTKELVQLLQGTITVQSWPGKGTLFIITLPVTQDAVEGATEFHPASVVEAVTAFTPSKANGKVMQGQVYELREMPRLLIIEDTEDVISYLRMCLNRDYRITEAHDGGEGIEVAINTIPDIIITDVMMPVKDGYEVCRTLKEDERTSHIPIIMLTARADTPSKLEGLETGVDAYLYKPFEKEELMIRLRKLLELRARLQRRYTTDESTQPVESRSVEREDQFISKLKEIIHARLDDEDFGILQLCQVLHLSRSQLHNKIKALTGRSTSLYIRLIRLRKAKELLGDPEMNISEVAYATGFRDPSYFRRCFVEDFGMSPSEFRQSVSG